MTVKFNNHYMDALTAYNMKIFFLRKLHVQQNG